MLYRARHPLLGPRDYLGNRPPLGNSYREGQPWDAEGCISQTNLSARDGNWFTSTAQNGRLGGSSPPVRIGMICDRCKKEIDGVETKLGWQEGIIGNEEDRVILTTYCDDCNLPEYVDFMEKFGGPQGWRA
jgi:hypothetical protein